MLGSVKAKLEEAWVFVEGDEVYGKSTGDPEKRIRVSCKGHKERGGFR